MRRLGSMEPSYTPLEHPLAEVVRRAVERGFGKAPIDVPLLGGSLPEPDDQVGDRRLAAAARPDDREHFAGATRERQPIEHGPPRSNDSVTLSNTTSPRRHARSRRRRRAPRPPTGRVEHLRHAAQRDARGGQVGVQPHQRLERRQEAHLVRHEGDEGADASAAVDHPAGRRRRTPRRCRPTASARAARPTDTSAICIDISASMNARFVSREPRRPRAPARWR